MDIQGLRTRYLNKQLSVREVVAEIERRCGEHADNPIWITRLNQQQLEPYLTRLEESDINELPLYGIPFAIKDNIDLAGIATTAACHEYAYTPDSHAYVVKKLIDAGAIPIGKTNLDQFATGLVGTRSPYGAVRNSFKPEYISGGSSSGSSVAVALGLVSFSLGTDTAGSGRVPAAFNNLIGLKPSIGLLSASGVVPACRSLDCVSIFAQNSIDAAVVLEQAQGFDPDDAYSRRASLTAPNFNPEGFRFAVPEQLEFFGNEEGERLFHEAVDALVAMGGKKVMIDFSPFGDAARLLYDGPWVTERYVAIEDFIQGHAEAMYPVTYEIISGGESPSAAAAFKAQYRLQALYQQSREILKDIDCVVTPTAGRCYTIDEVNAEPIKLNSNLGYYTNFMNLLDFAAVAVPAGMQSDGLPFGITLFAEAFTEASLLSLAGRLQRRLNTYVGARLGAVPSAASDTDLDGYIQVAVCGAHMSDLPLNYQLTERGAFLLKADKTAPHYHFYVLPGDGPVKRPGLVRAADGYVIDLEVWAMPISEFGSFMQLIPAPLGIGSVELLDGRLVPGFICEAYATEGAEEISQLGGWRAYIKQT